MFPDTAEFHADILTCDPKDFNSKMEPCAQLALCSFVPHRGKDDMMEDGCSSFPHAHKL